MKAFPALNEESVFTTIFLIGNLQQTGYNESG